MPLAYRILIMMSLCVDLGASPSGFTQFLGSTGLWLSKLGEILALISEDSFSVPLLGLFLGL